MAFCHWRKPQIRFLFQHRFQLQLRSTARAPILTPRALVDLDHHCCYNWRHVHCRRQDVGGNSTERLLTAALVTTQEISAWAAIRRKSINRGGAIVEATVRTLPIGTVVADGKECKKKGGGWVEASVGSSTSTDVGLAVVENGGAPMVLDGSKSVRHKV